MIALLVIAGYATVGMLIGGLSGRTIGAMDTCNRSSAHTTSKDHVTSGYYNCHPRQRGVNGEVWFYASLIAFIWPLAFVPLVTYKIATHKPLPMNAGQRERYIKELESNLGL